MGKLKKAIWGSITAAWLAGTFLGHRGDCPPLYMNRTEDGAGICASLITHVEPGVKFYGPVISLFGKNEGTIYGPFVSLVNENTGKVNGAMISVGSINGGTINGFYIPVIANVYEGYVDAKVNGLEATLLNFATNRRVNGIDVSAITLPKEANGIQIGAIAGTREKGLGLNISILGGSDGYFNGAQVSVTGINDEMDGLKVALLGYDKEFNGLEIAGVGFVGKGKNLQLGGYLYNGLNGHGDNRKSVLVNYNFKD